MEFTVVTAIVGLYFLAALGLIVGAARRNKTRVDDFFLAGRTLSWRAVALSMTGAAIGAEYWIGAVGIVYALGLAPDVLEWSKFVPFSILLWIVIPYFSRKKLSTLPEFLENRYSIAARSLFAGFILVYLALAIFAPALYAGGRILHEMLIQRPVEYLDGGFVGSIAVISIAAAGCSIYGGMKSIVWIDILQIVLLLAGGVALATSGFVIREKPPLIDKILLTPESFSTGLIPLRQAGSSWREIAAFWVALSIWHVVVNPLYIQRCLSAKSEWDAKMGTIGCAVLKGALATFVLLPALLAFSRNKQESIGGVALLPSISLCLSPLGQGIVLAALIAAIVSAAAGVLNVTSSIWALDIHKRLLQPDASDEKLVVVGRWTTFILAVIGTSLAPFLLWWEEGIFFYLQRIIVLIAPPISVIFLAAFFWRRAHGRSAVFTLLAGFGAGVVLSIPGSDAASFFVFPSMDSLLNRAAVNWIFCLAAQIAAAYLLPMDPRETADSEIFWNLRWARLPAAGRRKNRGFQNLLAWWVVGAGIAALMSIAFR